jgi:hypothetical protein
MQRSIAVEAAERYRHGRLALRRIVRRAKIKIRPETLVRPRIPVEAREQAVRQRELWSPQMTGLADAEDHSLHCSAVSSTRKRPE